MDFTDISQQARFTRMLDPGARAITFQTFPDDEALKERAGLTHVLHCGVDDPRLQQLNAAGAGVYASVSERADVLHPAYIDRRPPAT
jgi:hypothetical protein